MSCSLLEATNEALYVRTDRRICKVHANLARSTLCWCLTASDREDIIVASAVFVSADKRKGPQIGGEEP